MEKHIIQSKYTLRILTILLLIGLTSKALFLFDSAEAGSSEVAESSELSAIAPAASAEDQTVNVYSSRKEGLVQQLFDEFTAKTGIKVNFVTDKAPKLIARLESEGKNSPADVFLASDVGNLAYAADSGLLQTVESDVLSANIPAQYRDEQGKWFGLSQRIRAIFYAKERVKAGQLSTYEDLAGAKWKEKILIRSSSNVYNQSLLASLIAANGVEAAEKWTAGLVANFTRKPQGGDRDQIRAIAAGQGDVAVANSYYYGRMQNGNDADKLSASKVGIFFPNQQGRGAHANISGGGVAVHAKHKENAVKLLEYLTSTTAQKIYAEINHEYPISPDVELSETVAAWGDFKRDTLPLSAIAKHRAEVIKIADRAGWR